jgi:tetratricopeptide (TPR) repeat protein
MDRAAAIGILLAAWASIGAVVAAQPASDGLARAEAALRAGRPLEAERALRSLLQVDPDAFLARNLLGRVRAAQKRWEEARVEFEAALSRRPDDAVLHLNLGAACFELRRIEAAQAACLRALELDPTLALARLYLGRLAEEAGRLDEAHAHYSEAVALAPRDPWPHHFRGGLRLRTGRIQEALEDFERARDLAPDLPAVLWNLGLVLRRAGRDEEAEQVLGRFRRLAEAQVQDQALRLRVTSRMQAAERDLRSGHAESALVLLREAELLAPEVAGVQLLLAECFRQLGRAEDEAAARARHARLSGEGR